MRSAPGNSKRSRCARTRTLGDCRRRKHAVSLATVTWGSRGVDHEEFQYRKNAVAVSRRARRRAHGTFVTTSGYQSRPVMVLDHGRGAGPFRLRPLRGSITERHGGVGRGQERGFGSGDRRSAGSRRLAPSSGSSFFRCCPIHAVFRHQTSHEDLCINAVGAPRKPASARAILRGRAPQA